MRRARSGRGGRGGIETQDSGRGLPTNAIGRLARIGLEEDTKQRMKGVLHKRDADSFRDLPGGVEQRGDSQSILRPGTALDPAQMRGLLGARPAAMAGSSRHRRATTGTPLRMMATDLPLPESNLADALLAAGSAEGLMTPAMAALAMRRAGYREEDLDEADSPVHQANDSSTLAIARHVMMMQRWQRRAH